VFAWPEKTPRYARGSAMPDSRGVIDTWWMDPDKAHNAPGSEQP